MHLAQLLITLRFSAGWIKFEKVLSHYAEFNAETMKWEITFDELNEMIQFYLDKYWEETHSK